MKATRRPTKKPWRLETQDAERPVDADAFLRRLADVLLEVDAQDAKPQPDAKEMP